MRIWKNCTGTIVDNLIEYHTQNSKDYLKMPAVVSKYSNHQKIMDTQLDYFA